MQPEHLGQAAEGLDGQLTLAALDAAKVRGSDTGAPCCFTKSQAMRYAHRAERWQRCRKSWRSCRRSLHTCNHADLVPAGQPVRGLDAEFFNIRVHSSLRFC